MTTYIDNYDTALEMAGEALEDIVHLWYWSTNYDYDKSPWVVFLDLIGYYDEEFGGKPLRLLRLDFVSLDKVADCLKLYATRPYDVLNVINKLHEID